MENDIAEYLSKRAAFKLPVEPGTFLLQLTQPSAEPSTGQNKRRKSGPGKYFPTEPPGAARKDAVVDAKPAKEQLALAGRQALAVSQPRPWQKKCLQSLPSSPRLRHGHNIPSDSSKQGNFLKSRKKRKK